MEPVVRPGRRPLRPVVDRQRGDDARTGPGVRRPGGPHRPGRRPRLAGAGQPGDPGGAVRLKGRYYRLLEGARPVTRFAELGGLAEQLGRRFEARGWWQLAAQQRPGDPAAAAAVARLGPPRTDPHPDAGPPLLSQWVDV